jgi:Fuc2NAc and GlcNAc transferase
MKDCHAPSPGILRALADMPRFVLFAVATVWISSAILTGIVRRFAMARGMLDVPNERSSHTTVTPRGGGLSILLVCSITLIAFAAFGLISRHLAIALVGGGIGVGAVGFLDDRQPLPAGLRLAVHLAAATWAVAWLGGLPPLRVGDLMVSLGGFGSVLAVLGIVWTLNLFNFMDGIDGIAASESVFIAGAAILLSLRAPPTDAVVVAAIFSASCAGFLIWNWPPAKIFMGDVGSGYIGYVIPVLALEATRSDAAAMWVWLLLGGAFFVDATITLGRRTLRGERLHEAHRSHAYQWLARKWGTHRPVTLAVLGVNILWLFPAAWLAQLHPSLALWILAGAFAPLVVLVLAAGAGRREQATR